MENNKKTSAQRAQDKFKRVGTKLNERELAKFNEILEREGVNQSQYIKGLIFQDKTTNEEIEKEKLEEEIEQLKKEIASIEELGFWDIVRLRFFPNWRK